MNVNISYRVARYQYQAKFKTIEALAKGEDPPKINYQKTFNSIKGIIANVCIKQEYDFVTINNFIELEASKNKDQVRKIDKCNHRKHCSTCCS